MRASTSCDVHVAHSPAARLESGRPFALFGILRPLHMERRLTRRKPRGSLAGNRRLLHRPYVFHQAAADVLAAVVLMAMNSENVAAGAEGLRGFGRQRDFDVTLRPAREPPDFGAVKIH